MENGIGMFDKKIVKETYVDNEGVIVYENEYEAKTRHCARISIKENSRFSKLFHRSGYVEFSKDSYYRYWLLCLCNLEKGTNCITKHKTVNNEAYNYKELVELFGCSERHCWNFLKECRDKWYIRKVSNEDEFMGYYLNPLYSFNGHYINPILYRIFKTDISKQLNDKEIKVMEEYILRNMKYDITVE